MNMFFLGGKIITASFWFAVVLAMFEVFSAPVASLLKWAAVIIMGVHAVEAIIFRRRFGQFLMEPKYDMAMVLIFGVFHMMPIVLRHAQQQVNK